MSSNSERGRLNLSVHALSLNSSVDDGGLIGIFGAWLGVRNHFKHKVGS